MASPEHARGGVEPPGMFDSILLLPPVVQLLAAGLALAMGAAAVWMFPSSPGTWTLFVGCAALGVPLGLRGLKLLDEQKLEARERARAEAELDELRALVLEAVEQARAVERMLTKRGYTSAKVRRWIALECGVVFPRRDP